VPADPSPGKPGATGAPCGQRAALDALHARYNDRSWLEPDPLAVVLEYRRAADLELAGLVCAALALGSAPQIVKACRSVLSALGRPRSGPGIAAGLSAMDDASLGRALSGFRYRFFDGDDLAAFLAGARNLALSHGSLEAAFLSGAADEGPGDADYAGAASRFTLALRGASPAPWKPNLFPDPARGSAAKRVFLYLRWMVRRDAVDPGPWRRADPARLLVPLDTHMAAACRRMGFLSRKSTDLAAAREATASFRALCPEDPVRWDFCMTRPGIRPDLDPDECFGSL